MPSHRLTDDELAEFEEQWKRGVTADQILKARDTASLAALGIPIQFGDLGVTFSPVTIARLGVIDSPFVAEGDGDLTLTESDIAAAVYALAGGDEAVAPIYGMRQRRADLDARKPMMDAKGPEFARVWLEMDMRLSEAWRDFHRDAAAFYREHCGGMDIQDAADAMMRGLADAFEWADSLASGELDAKKKPVAPSTASGSATSSANWWRAVSRIMKRCMPPWRKPAGSTSASGGPTARTSSPATAPSTPR